MTEDTKDDLAIWGLALIALLALAGAWTKFGSIGEALTILLLIFPAHRVVLWMEDAQRLRRQEECPKQ
jgi:hypothetical protein